jgi:E3 ubiquitin-protein ligase HUWE1
MNNHLLQFGVNKIVPLKEKGEVTQVTQENKREYVQLSAQYRLYSSIKDQIESLLGGFYEIIPKDLITIVGCFSFNGWTPCQAIIVQ